MVESGEGLEALEFAALDGFDGEDLLAFGGEGEGDIAQVADEFAEAIGFETRGVVGAFPRAVEGEVAFEPSGSVGEGGDVGGDAEVVSAEADGFDAGFEGGAEAEDFLEADILEGHGVAGGAAVDDEIAVAATRFEMGDDALLFFAGSHAERKVDFAAVIGSEHIEEGEVEVAGAGDFDEGGGEGGDLAGGGDVPDAGGVEHAPLLAAGFEAAMLIEVEFEGLAVGSVGGAVGIGGVGVRGVVFFSGEEFAVVALLEFDHIGAAELCGDTDHVEGGFQVTAMVAADLGDHAGQGKGREGGSDHGFLKGRVSERVLGGAREEVE